MSRVIKFRAWDKIDGVMHDCLPEILFGQNAIAVAIEGEDGGHIEKRLFEDVELMQFTGLLDKNGNEIYEGDVIHCTAGMRTADKSFQTDEVKAIKFEDGAFRYDGITLGDMVSTHMSEYTFEVIGNIYENKELLT